MLTPSILQRSRFHQPIVIAVVSLFAVLLGLSAPTSTHASSTAVQTESQTISRFISQQTGNYSATSTSSNGNLTIPTGLTTTTFTTDWMSSKIDMNAVGVLLNGKFEPHSHNTEQRSVTLTAELEGAEGTITRQLSIVGDDLKEAASTDKLHSSPLFVEGVERFRIHLTLERTVHGESPLVSQMEIITMDSRTTVGVRSASNTESTTEESVTSNNQPKIISREEWGADESYRFTSDDAEVWPQTIRDPEVFIVHHTAGTDGGADPSATIRGVYYWHAVVLGWGDIGYNYLIDPDGNIYKGRKGGLGVVGAHAYNSVDDINFNYGSIGIALLGCFEETPGACTSTHTTTPEMEESLAQLVGWLGAEADIDPSTSTTFYDREVYRVVGHRDVDYTYCPGSGVNNDLTGIRSQATAFYQQIGGREATFKAVHTKTIETAKKKSRKNLDLSKNYTLTLRYTNTSEDTWTQDTLRLRLTNKSGKKPSPMRHKSWSKKRGMIQMNQEEVAPGETATFKFTISPPRKRGKKKITAQLYIDGSALQGSKKVIPLTYKWPYQGELTANDLPTNAGLEETLSTTLTFQNTGKAEWGSDVALYINREEVTAFSDETPILSGESGTLTVDIQTAKKVKTQHVVVELKRNGRRVRGSRQVLHIKTAAE